MTVHSFEELLAHVGHEVRVVTYGDPGGKRGGGVRNLF